MAFCSNFTQARLDERAHKDFPDKASDWPWKIGDELDDGDDGHIRHWTLETYVFVPQRQTNKQTNRYSIYIKMYKVYC